MANLLFEDFFIQSNSLFLMGLEVNSTIFYSSIVGYFVNFWIYLYILNGVLYRSYDIVFSKFIGKKYTLIFDIYHFLLY